MDMEPFADTLAAHVSDDGVLWLTKVNADVGYGISMKMLQALETVFTGLKTDASIRAVVIDAEGNTVQNGAVVVGDIKPSLKDLDRDDFAEVVNLGHKMGRIIADADVPVISIAKNGIVGGGLELMLRSDFAFSTDQAEFSLPEVNLGFIAAWGGTRWGGRFMPFRKAQEFLLTGLPIDGKQAEEYGLITRSFANSDALDAHLANLLVHLRNCSPTAFRWTKKCLAAVWEGTASEGEKIELEAEVETMASGDFHKALGAFRNGHFFDFSDDTEGGKR